MAHAQKPHCVFRRNGRVHLNRRGASVQSTTGSRFVRISGSNAGYTMFRGSVKSIGYLLHLTVSSSLHLPCVTVCRHISIGIYLLNGILVMPTQGMLGNIILPTNMAALKYFSNNIRVWIVKFTHNCCLREPSFKISFQDRHCR